ncbi:MAG: ribonuclease P protein component [Akkermansiaceae bacterium]
MRLRRKYSMTRHAEFARAREHGRSKSGQYLVLSSLLDPELPHHKAGIIVTKKVGNAVVRHRLKRRIHAILAKHFKDIDCSEGNRYIVTILRWRAPEASSVELEYDWLNQARRLGLIKSTT